MNKWDKFFGCMLLSKNEMIDFLLYIENSDRMKTEEGKFLHYQYLRELMSSQYIGKGRLSPENGALNYYNIDSITRKLKWMDKNLHSFSRMAIPAMEKSLEIVKNMYTEDWYSETFLTDRYTDEPIDGGFGDIVETLVEKKQSLLLSNHNILYKKFPLDVYIMKGDKTYSPSTFKLLIGWCHNEYKVDDIYVYQANVLSPLSFKFNWKGYNESTGQIETGTSTMNSMRWLNI